MTNSLFYASNYMYFRINSLCIPSNLNGTWHDLRAIGTEGQLEGNSSAQYKKISLTMGAGLRYHYQLNSLFNIGCSVNAIKTFTDYLDDVSGNYFAFGEA